MLLTCDVGDSRLINKGFICMGQDVKAVALIAYIIAFFAVISSGGFLALTTFLGIGYIVTKR